MNIKWNKQGEDEYRAIVGDTILFIEQMGRSSWSWVAYLDKNNSVLGNERTLRDAKAKARYQVTYFLKKKEKQKYAKA